VTLKWGTLKSWSFHSDKSKELIDEYNKVGSSMSAIMQHDTPRQKEILCELIDDADIEYVYLDWDDKQVSKKEAKEYILSYGKKSDTIIQKIKLQIK
jgi:hypothetical protein